MKILSMQRAATLGYSRDRRKRRRQHRAAAKALIEQGTFLNPGKAPQGSVPHSVALWHLQQARLK